MPAAIWRLTQGGFCPILDDKGKSVLKKFGFAHNQNDHSQSRLHRLTVKLDNIVMVESNQNEIYVSIVKDE